MVTGGPVGTAGPSTLEALPVQRVLTLTANWRSTLAGRRWFAREESGVFVFLQRPRVFLHLSLLCIGVKTSRLQEGMTGMHNGVRSAGVCRTPLLGGMRCV